MGFGFKQSSYDAVLFIDKGQVVKEMLYSEFEAVLDGIVGEPDYAGQTCHAVYLKIDTSLIILGAVFFTIDFDNDGAADKHWNLPLSQLVETAAFGAELNGSSIRVACSSQCQIPWHHDSLWEPDLSATSNTFKIIDTSIKKNKLGLVVERKNIAEAQASASTTNTKNVSLTNEKKHSDESVDVDSVDSQAATEYESEARIQMARNLKKLRLHIHSLKTRHQQDLDTLKSQLAREKDSLLERLNESVSDNKLVKHSNTQLQAEIEHLHVKLNEQKLNYEKQISDSLNKQGLDYDELRRQFRQDLQQKLIAQTGDLRDKLEMKELELHYRQDQIELLNSELQELKSEIISDNAYEPDREVNTLAKLGVHFVMSLPGVGPLNIPARELSEYRADPAVYLANRLSVDKNTYLNWFKHASYPHCSASNNDDSCCDKPIDLILPHEFIMGVSDRCVQHQVFVSKAANG